MSLIHDQMLAAQELIKAYRRRNQLPHGSEQWQDETAKLILEDMRFREVCKDNYIEIMQFVTTMADIPPIWTEKDDTALAAHLAGSGWASNGP